MEIVESRSPSPSAGSGDDGDSGDDDGDSGDDDDDGRGESPGVDDDDRGESPGVDDGSDQYPLPTGAEVLRIQRYPFKSKPTNKTLYKYLKSLPHKDLYVWFPDQIEDGNNHPSGLAPGWHRVTSITEPKHKKIRPYFYEMKFDRSEFRDEDECREYNAKKDPPWNFSIPKGKYYCPTNKHGNWTILYKHVVTMNDEIEEIAADGNCLYRAIAWVEGYREEPAQTFRITEYRNECFNYYINLTDEQRLEHGFDTPNQLIIYANKVLQDGEWGSEKELVILSKKHGMNFHLYYAIPGESNKYNLFNRDNTINTTDSAKTGHYLYTGSHYNVFRVGE